MTNKFVKNDGAKLQRTHKKWDRLKREREREFPKCFLYNRTRRKQKACFSHSFAPSHGILGFSG